MSFVHLSSLTYDILSHYDNICHCPSPLLFLYCSIVYVQYCILISDILKLCTAKRQVKTKLFFVDRLAKHQGEIMMAEKVRKTDY